MVRAGLVHPNVALAAVGDLLGHLSSHGGGVVIDEWIGRADLTPPGEDLLPKLVNFAKTLLEIEGGQRITWNAHVLHSPHHWPPVLCSLLEGPFSQPFPSGRQPSHEPQRRPPAKANTANRKAAENMILVLLGADYNRSKSPPHRTIAMLAQADAIPIIHDAIVLRPGGRQCKPAVGKPRKTPYYHAVLLLTERTCHDLLSSFDCLSRSSSGRNAGHLPHLRLGWRPGRALRTKSAKGRHGRSAPLRPGSRLTRLSGWRATPAATARPRASSTTCG